jgi:hypothetical protein
VHPKKAVSSHSQFIDGTLLTPKIGHAKKASTPVCASDRSACPHVASATARPHIPTDIARRTRRRNNTPALPLDQQRNSCPDRGKALVAKANHGAAIERAEALRSVFAELADLSARAAAPELDRRGIATPSGAKWSAMAVLRVRERLARG